MWHGGWPRSSGSGTYAMPSANGGYEPLLRKALERIEELEAELAAARSQAPEPGSAPEPGPVAVVGLSCRFPGAAGSREYWRLLAGGAGAITEVPADRWD